MSSRPTRTLLPGSGPYLGDEEVAVTMQVAIHLNDVEHGMFSRWLASTAIAVDPDNPHPGGAGEPAGRPDPGTRMGGQAGPRPAGRTRPERPAGSPAGIADQRGTRLDHLGRR